MLLHASSFVWALIFNIGWCLQNIDLLIRSSHARFCGLLGILPSLHHIIVVNVLSSLVYAGSTNKESISILLTLLLKSLHLLLHTGEILVGALLHATRAFVLLGASANILRGLLSLF